MMAFPPSSPSSSLRISLTLAAVLLAVSTSVSPAAPETWAQSYGVGSYGGDGKPTTEIAYGSGYDYPTGIAAMPDGGVVVAGHMAYPKLYTPFVGNPPGRGEATMVRFASDGTILWQRTLDQTNDELRTVNGQQYFTPALSHVNEVATDAQGNVFIGGGKGNPANGSEVAFIAKFSPTGERIWQNGIARAAGTYGSPPRTYDAGIYPIENMALTADGGVVVTLRQIRPGTADNVLALVKFNADGAIALYRALEHPFRGVQPGPICQSRDGSRYVTAMSHRLSKNSVGADINGTLLLIFDLEGNLIGQRGWASLDFVNETPLKIIATADGGFASLAKRGLRGGFVLRKFNADASATTLEKAIYPTSSSTSPSFDPLGFAETPGGGFLISSHRPTATGRTNAGLTKVSADGVLQFVSQIGGPLNEGTSGGIYTPEEVHAVPTTDGGYAFATLSVSYKTGPVEKPDWWVGKTDANRRIRNFPGTMSEEAVNLYTVIGSTGAAIPVSDYVPPTYTAGPVVSSLPAFNVLDPSTFAVPNAPTVAIQASGPRIVSSRTVTAVIRQHFSYSIASAFFGPGQALTYSATNLPPGFVINPATGVISGAPQPGSATTLPFFIGLQVTNGLETAQAVLSLRIGEPVPMLTVNGSDQPRHPDPGATAVTGLADTVLQFAVDHPSQLAGHRVTMQSSTDPLGIWSNLSTGLAGQMDYDEGRQTYVLNTTNYPAQNGVFFRSQVAAPGFTTIFSNVVGPFNLASAQPRAGRTLFAFKGNELRADFDFRATQLEAPSAVALRVESTMTPAIESSWTDVQDEAGALLPVMRQEVDKPTVYSLTTNNLAEFSGTYFRAIAAGAGLVDSVSNIVGPKNSIRAIPPTVTLTVIAPPGAGSGQTPEDRVVLTANAAGVASAIVKTTVIAGAGRSLSSVSLLLDGVPVHTFPGTGMATTVEYERDVKLGPHDFQVLAVDDLGTTGRAGTMPVYVSVRPAVALAAPRTRDLTFRPELYTVANSGGNWSDPGTWRNAQGNPGVPTSNDLVIIGGATVNLAGGGGGSVYTMSLNGGRLVGPGQIRINSFLSVAGGSFDSSVTLAIQPGATCDMLNAADFRFDGVVLNQGTFNVRGARSILGIKEFLNFGGGVVNFLPPLLRSAAFAADLPPGPPLIECGAVEDAGRVRAQPLSPSATFVNFSGGNIISRDGAGLLGQDAAGLIGQDVAGLIGQDVAGLIGQDVAGLIKVGLQAPAGLRAPRDGVARTGYLKTGGDIDLTGLVISGPVKLEGGVLTGSGVIQGNLTNNGGFIAPGNPAGSLLVTGDFAQGPLGTLVMEAAGGAAGQFDQFLVGGAASLGGKLEMRFIGGYLPLPNDSLNPIGFASATGAFASISSNAQLEVTPNGLIAVLDPAQVPSPGDFPIFLTDAQRLEGGNFLLRGKGRPVSRYTIEASISPTDFQPIDGVTAAPDGTFEFQDVNAPAFSRRFYRAVGP